MSAIAWTRSMAGSSQLRSGSGRPICGPWRNSDIFVHYRPVRRLLISCKPVEVIHSIPVITTMIQASLTEVFVEICVRPVVWCKLHWRAVLYDRSTSYMQIKAGVWRAVNAQLVARDHNGWHLTVIDEYWPWCRTTEHDAVLYWSDMDCARWTLN